jgi:pimeloyl-ACP methyl ester carboxylesterase
MEKILIVSMLLIWTGLTSGCVTTSQTIKLNTSKNYSTAGSYYLADKSKPNKAIEFIAIHGKSGRPDADHQLNLYPKLTNAGYDVIAIKMPWSRDWDGTLEDGMQIIDAAVSQVVKKGKKVVLIGHSLGGAAVLIYAANSPAKDVAGIVTVAPGHMLHRSNRMQRVSYDSVEKARHMVLEGKANSESSFKVLNTGKVTERYMSAKVYLSYFDTQKFPDIEQLLPDIKLPVLWVAGREDRLTLAYDMEILFEDLVDSKSNKYLEITGDHKSVLANSSMDIISWSESLR